MQDDMEDRIGKFVEDSDGEVVDTAPVVEEYAPQYRIMADDKIPVAKKHGQVWKSRFRAAVQRLKTNKDTERWDAAIRYYRNDHQQRRDSNEDGDNDRGTNLATRGVETENIVFANTSALLPAIYAKNPSVEVSMDDPEFEEFGKVCNKLLNVLFRTRSAPGVNLKPKARRAVLMASLSNYAYFEVGYTKKEQSAEAVNIELTKLTEELEKATKQDQIKEIEGKLAALEDKVDVLGPSGPFVKYRRPHDVLIDPDASTITDAGWLMIGDYMSTDYLRATYGKKNEKGEWESVFTPTHLLKVDASESDNVDDEINNFSLFASDNQKPYTDYGFESEETFQKAHRTRVWYVWDKTTRRVYLFNEHDWTWPLWVWDDPYQFPQFFPIREMSFYDDPQDYYARSETMMYLDQQDGINAINNEIAKNRSYIMGKVVYNKSIIKDENAVSEFLAGTNKKRALGLDLPPDAKLTDLFQPFAPQSAQVLNTVVFDKQRLLEAINRVSSVTDVMRGVEYKTNTTNKAIENYESTNQSRLDEKIDAIEDALGEVGEMLLHLCLQHMDAETVARLIGAKDAELWGQGREAFLSAGITYSAQIVGGSTLKPTSATKKQQAIQLSQAVGQFASATPMAIIVALKIMERAFDEVVVTKDDWKMIIDSIGQQLQRGNSQGGQGGPTEGGGAEGGGGPTLEQLEQLVDQMPPEAKQALAQLIASDTPIREAIGAVVKELQGAEGNEQPTQ